MSDAVPVIGDAGLQSPLDILAGAQFFRRASPQQRARLASLGTLASFASGSQIYRVGEPANNFYVLTDGVVRFSLPMGQRQATAGEIIKRGDVFGWAALVGGTQLRVGTASCLVPASAFVLDGRRMLAAMEADHGLGYVILKELTLLITGTLAAFAAG